MDRLVQDAARVAASQAALRETASTLTRLTGEGIVGAVLAGAAFLVAAGRRRDALVVVGGTLGAWALSAGLKVAFAVPRPNRHEPWHAITGYGFPSAHVLVAVVACGLLAWALGREARRGVRVTLYAGAAAIGMLAGAARVILNAHWLSDVIAGLAVGVVWLILVLLSISHSSAPDGGRHP
ncbi:MAG: phosphatase PAP2 family protein [Candidatus Rokubacteria bacterium]|nr:phosphatase PAP2 family protein [Candidatus Rokubacteria bacterium]